MTGELRLSSVIKTGGDPAHGRLDAVDDIMENPTFGGAFSSFASGMIDLEVCTAERISEAHRPDQLTIQRLVSRIHAGSVKQRDFLAVVQVRLLRILVVFSHQRALS